MGRSRSSIAIIAIVVLSAALRFYHLGYHDLRGDEAFSISFVSNSWESIVAHLRSGEPHPPLYFSLLKVWMAVAGSSEFAARWLSAAAGIALAPLLFACGRALGSERLGLIAAFLAATNPYHIWNGQDVRMYALVTTFSAAVLCFGLRFGTRKDGPSRSDALGLAIASVLAAYTHYVAVVVVATVYALLALHALAAPRRERGDLRLLVLSAVVFGIVYLPWLAVGLPVLGDGYGGTQSSPEATSAVRAVVTTFAAGELFTGPTADYMAAAFGALAIGGSGALLWRRRFGGALVLAVPVVAFVALLIASQSRPVFSARYLMLVSPALFLASAAAVCPPLAWSASGVRRPARFLHAVTAYGVALVLVGGTAIALHEYYLDRGGQGPGTWRPYVSFIVESAAASDLVVVNHLDPSFFYYYDRLGGKAKAIVQPSRPGQTDAERDEELTPLLPKGGLVWFVPDGVRLWDKDGAVEKWLDRSAVRETDGRVAGMEYVRYRVPAGVEVGTAFGNRLELLRYEVRGGAQARKPGEELVLDLCWRAVSDIDEDLMISVQLLDEKGTLVAQSDGQPAGGNAPTSGWRPGETVVDTRSLRLPDAEGEYDLGTVVYEYTSGKRLFVEGTPSGMLVLERIRIGH